MATRKTQGIMYLSTSDKRRHEVSKRTEKDSLDKQKRREVATTMSKRHKAVMEEQNTSLLSKIDTLMHGRPPRFCIVRTLGGLGDALMVTPIFKALKEQYPDCHITYGTTKEYSDGVLFDILENNPHIDELIPYQQAKKEDYDLYADVTSLGVKEEHVFKEPRDRQSIWAKHVGIDCLDDGKCVYVVEPDEKEFATEWLDDHKKTKKSRFIVVQPGSFADRRNWPRDNIIELMDKIHKYDKSIVFLVHDYGVAEYKGKWDRMPNVVNISNFNIRSIAAIMEQADLVIAHDSGILHLAGALDCKIVSIFGSTHPKSRINWFKNCIAVWQKDLACSPCWYSSCSNHYYCMKALDVKDVYDASIFMLDKWQNGGKNNFSSLSNVDYFFGFRSMGFNKSGRLNSKEVFPIRRLTKPLPKKYRCNLSILMVTMNNYKYLKDTIDDVLKYTEDFELLIYQNAREKDSQVSDYLDKLCKDNKNIKIIKDSKNSGFLEPNNALAKKAKGKYMCLLNDDMTLCKDWADTMIHTLESDSTLAQVGIDNTCKSISHDGCGVPGDTVEYIEGSCVMMPYTIYNEHGLFDEEHYSFAYFEDNDLSLRLREQGWDLATVKLPVVHHREKTSSKVKIDINGHAAKNKWYWQHRWATYLKKRSFKYQINLIRKGANGDMLMLTPVIRALKDKYPLSNITITTDCGEILGGNPYVHSIIDKPMGHKADITIDLNNTYEAQPGKHVVDCYYEAANIEPTYRQPEIYLPDDIGKDVPDLPDNYIVIDLGITWQNRTWPLSSYENLIKTIKKEFSDINIVGIGKDITRNIKGIDTRFNMSMHEAAYCVSKSILFIGHEGFISHMAEAFDKPRVIIPGCTCPDEFIWRSGNEIVLQDESLECLNCNVWAPYPRDRDQCLRPDGRPVCLTNITSNMVIDNVKEIIENGRS